MKTNPTIVELSFATFELFDNYVISTIKDSVFFDFQHLEEMSQLFQSHFQLRPFVSVANRKFEYTINPICLLQSDYIPQLLGIAVVSHTPAGYTAAKFEEQFYKNPFKVFHNMETALKWTQELIEKAKNS